MAESLADKDNDPGDRYIALYDTWSTGGWGAVLTGEMEVSTIYMGHPGNVHSKPSLSQATKDKWKRWALVAQQNNTLAFVQLVHPGRQSPAGVGNRSFFAKAIAPSAVPVDLGSGVSDYVVGKVLFGTPRAMSIQEIHEAIQQFASAAKLCYDSGFAGVQIHTAHGFLLTQFLSPKTNIRTNEYGGTPAKQARIVVEIIRAIRAVVPPSFCVSIKLNSADVGGHESLDESLEQVGLIRRVYRKHAMATGDETQAKSARTIHRKAFFLDYARSVRAQYPDVIPMVTGGFRSRKGMQAALDSGACDLIGLARPSAVWPRLVKEVLLNKEVKDEDARCELRTVRGNWFVRNLMPRVVGVGVDVLYYAGQIARLAEGKEAMPPPVGA
ncbi:NADH:flavin oxidoreductase/NADH oxidase [Bimuria novae-zelandiae CBS 107.79]|uniref:NADH:flavin oxidoreductase/NADH oxidase n=1 Tax=Bimuria novae-zelandiae CBS 107.79 TaxID=1447943 RepID=A0A6A5VDJ1_9PLEO|nr:NADH:flavin oxidoreductase/NADH oxidase [Bimuria novae-zelandiae CBS 107.79]